MLRSPTPGGGARKTAFAPYVEARLRVFSEMPVGRCYVKVYFFDGAGRLISGPATPWADQVDPTTSKRTVLPYYLFPHKPVTVRIPAPGEILERNPGWTAVVVFGDDEEVAAAAVKTNAAEGERTSPFWFPAVQELKLVAKPGTPPRKKSLDRVHELKCQTGLPDYPQFTLFTRLPEGAKSGKEAKGVLCLALLANQVEDVRLSMINREARGSIADMLRYADKQRLIVLCWAIRSVWTPGANWDELSAAQDKETRTRMKKVADGWASGVMASAKLHDFEPRNFLLWGYSDSAQFAERLAMFQPRFFGAVHLHNPGGFEKPVQAAEHIVWGLTMGEVDSGYGRAVKWQRACFDLGYTLFFKAVPGMGHANDLGSRQLATLVFEYSRSLPANPKERLAKMADDRKNAKWVGDWLNQSVETGAEITTIPPRLRVPFPNESLVKSWLRGEPLRPGDDPAGETPPAAYAAAAAAMREGGVEKDYDELAAMGNAGADPALPPPPAPATPEADNNGTTFFGKRIEP
ncbi:MAG: hypothetical protein LBG65_07925 [Puniceicoccales bacterium]|nr:hypothetical protein [Puniceicoccales bacterium]